MKKITLVMKPERVEMIKERLENAGLMEVSYLPMRSYSHEAETIWWRGAVPMVQHYTNWVRLEVLVGDAELDKALRVLAHFVDKNEIKGYISSVQELELKELVTV